MADNNIVYWTDLKDETFLFSQRDPGPEFQDILLAKLAAPGERPFGKISRFQTSSTRLWPN